jgi:flagellar biosynthesis protein FlhG
MSQTWVGEDAMMDEDGVYRGGKTGIPRVMSITSGKGGVGKTNTAVNLAIALAERGRRVLLMDCDFGLANVDVMFGIRPSQTLEQVILSNLPLKEAIVETPHGVSLIAAASGIESLAVLSVEQRMRMCAELESVARGYDYLLIDTQAGIGPDVMYFNAVSSEVLVVITPEPTSIADAYALIKVLVGHYGETKISLVVNNVSGFDEDPERLARRAATRLMHSCERFLRIRVSYLGFIPHDSAVSAAILRNRPLLEIFPTSQSGLSLRRLAKRVDEVSEGPQVRGGLQLFFQDILARQVAL